MSKLFSSTGLQWLWVSAVVLILDITSKLLILKNFSLGERLFLFPSLSLRYVRNYGIAFGLLSTGYDWKRWFFSAISAGICGIITVLMYQLEVCQKINSVAYALIIGGALGNLFDRILYGFVIDMIDFHVGDWHFAIFNLADSGIFLGSLLLLWKYFFCSFSKSKGNYTS